MTEDEIYDECWVCGELFSDTGDLEVHIEEHREDDPE